VLISAAVLGQRFPLDLLADLVDDATSIQGTLHNLLEQGLLDLEQAAGDPAGGARFRHELVREVLYELVTRDKQRAIHDRVATLLLKRKDSMPAEEIGRHLELAGRDSEAAERYEQAADLFAQHEDSEQEERLLGLAIAALERAEATGLVRRGDTPQRLSALLTRRARACNRTSRWEVARSAALKARNTALQVGDVILAARASRELARAAAEQGDLMLADSTLSEAYQTALECGDLDLAADLASNLGEYKEREGRLDEATTLLVEALTRLEGASRRSTRSQGRVAASRMAEVHNRLGRVSLRAKRTDEAIRCFNGALKWAELGDDRSLAARVLGNLGQTQALTGDAVGAQQTLRQALDAMEQVGDRLGTAKLLHNLSRLLLDVGKRTEAETMAREAFELSVEIGWREGEALGSALLDQMRH
jgi:tetratricopeptide (TPR) repeat protein